ncbi:MAG: hypothetical protein VB108_05710 [Anaerolineaceae bacterium]|nr:hypothetical protein [Anaerolineaceae bacterium]
MKEKCTEKINLRIPREIRDRLNDLAGSRNKGLSFLVKDFIAKGIRSESGKPPKKPAH